MELLLKLVLFLSMGYNVQLDPSMNFNVKEAVFEPFMLAKKAPHVKASDDQQKPGGVDESWPYDFSKFDSYLSNAKESSDSESPDHNRVKRKSKKSRRKSTTLFPYNHLYELYKNSSMKPDVSTEKSKSKNNFDTYESPLRKYNEMFIEMPKDLYQAHLRPGVIFRIHMSEAILKMQYRNYAENKDESVIEADVEYLRLTRKVINDEITKFEDLRWLVDWFANRTDLINEHACNMRYFAVGIPPTMFTHSEEYMKRSCLFDNVYLDHIPYVIGDDGSLMAAVAPPVLHCDAATCTSVPFIDSLMFDERLPRTNVRTVTRCQASCRAHCRNDADCLTRCSDRCARPD